ncbi:MAG TPA: ABC transporter ATP-binding protein [Candidatus Acidoferrum sp.]|jgi:ABC-type multidrug transport system ATPase subunit|nr:ABC transporter ATP-binding protein [Candidatus Acidoferrum sp.]
MNIVLGSLTKKFGSVRALENFSATIEPGQIIAVLGPNGAGKTTLLRLLAAIAAPDRGKILYDGESFNRGRIDLRRRLYFLPDFPLVFSQISVARQIATVLDLYGINSESAGDAVIRHLNGLDLLHTVDTSVGKLSRGQIFKVALATMLTIDPELWLLDEPFASGMDPMGIGYFKEQARQAATRGRIIIYSTQILDIAERFSDRVALIYRGELKVFDSVDNLRDRVGRSDSVLEGVFQKLREDNS